MKRKALGEFALYILSIFGIGMLVSGCGNDRNSKVVDDLTLHYLNNHIYDPVSCDGKTIKEVDYVLCYPVSMDIGIDKAKEMGALYKIKYDEKGQYTIFAVNGKAKTHSEIGGYPIAKDLYDTTIDIPVIKKEF